MAKEISQSFKKFLETLILIFGSVWIGSQLSKILTLYYFFQTDQYGRISLKTEIMPDIINSISYQLTPIFSINLISYIIFILLILVYTFIIRKSLKQKGWLFISIIIIILCLPFEIYASIFDFKIFEYSYYRIGDSKTILSLFENRIISLSSFPLISIFLHLITYFLIIFKPLDKRSSFEN